MFSSQNSQVSNDANYIEDVFSTYLYTGTGSGISQTITNGIDLSTKGGLVWIKDRNSTASGHGLWDTIRGAYKFLVSSSTGAQVDASGSGFQYGVGSFNNNGFTLPTPNQDYWNVSGTTYASWTFRKQPKFFDVLTYTGDGTSNRAISHNLGSTPGCIIVKQTNAVNSWAVLHRGDGSTSYSLTLNSTGAGLTPPNASAWGNGSSYVAPTSTQFTVGTSAATNASGGTYVAYIYAHNAGGFGLTGTDNVISCGSFTTNGSGNATIDLGYEPQWVLTKRTNSTGPWGLYDTMRGWSYSAQNYLLANDSGAEGVINATGFKPTATGFTTSSPFDASATYIYIAIRRGPMKVPTDATKVFAPVSQASHGTVTTNFPVDLTISTLNALGDNRLVIDRLRGSIKGSSYVPILETNATVAEQNFGSGATYYFGYDNNTGYVDTLYNTGFNIIYWNFKRAPSFFDEVCYTGDGTSNRAIPHNLSVMPELIISKKRSAAGEWYVWSKYYSYALGTAPSVYCVGQLDSTMAFNGGYSETQRFSPTPTSSNTYTGSITSLNNSGDTYVSYLFATCAGVSKCTAFTGNGTSQTINCGFTSGARFVMIKATSTTGNWTIFDSARGISAGGDPALYLNSTAAEVTGVDAIDADSTGFIVNQESTFNLNASGVQYLVLAIA